MLNRIAGLKLTPTHLTILLACALVAFYNGPLWELTFSRSYDSALSKGLFVGSFYLFLAAFLNFWLSLTAFRHVLKPVAITLLLTASVVSYFMDSYGVVIDKTMLQNMVETDVAEVNDLLSIKLVLYFIGLGLLPALLVLRLPLHYHTRWSEFKRSAASAALSLVVLVGVALPFYADYASFFRNNHHIRLLITPTNSIYAAYKYLAARDSEPEAIHPIGLDATQRRTAGKEGKKSLLVLVVGETARAQNFSLNGYARQTNPLLSKDGVINFVNARSCGTSTAVSVPCMFSRLGHEDYNDAAAKHEENLLDVLHHAGIEVLWRDNNSGCKGLCDRVRGERVNLFSSAKYCTDDHCFDEVLLNGLDNYLQQLSNDALIVLHEQGSHGPAYYKRYPESFEAFTPVCRSNQLQNCSSRAITNTYDNTILYTDYFLHRVILFLKQHSNEYNTAMLYASDHGESLGENNIYLHGMPYFMAPEEQTRIPFLLWMSQDFARAKDINPACLANHSGAPVSHDNLFHSILGLYDIQTQLHNKELDIFSFTFTDLDPSHRP